MHIAKMIMTVMGLIYFSATIWDVTTSYIYMYSNDGDKCFWRFYNLDVRLNKEVFILSMYFAFTTMSSVGFGDITPKTDLERLICAFIMLFGVAMFSYVQNISMQTIERLLVFNRDYEQYYLLKNFLNVIKKFNTGQGLPSKF